MSDEPTESAPAAAMGRTYRALYPTTAMPRASCPLCKVGSGGGPVFGCTEVLVRRLHGNLGDALGRGVDVLAVGLSGHGECVRRAWAMTGRTVGRGPQVERSCGRSPAVDLEGHEEPAGRPVQR